MKKNILLAACFLMPLIASAQNETLTHERDITLAEAIALARTQSVDAAVALNELKTAYWEYRTFRADLLPEVNFTGTLPNYNKSYSTYQNSDGSYSFVRNNTLGLSGALSIDQNIWFTGGKLSLASSLDYIKQLGSGGDKQFMSVPVSLELTQPIFRREQFEVEPPYRAGPVCGGKSFLYFRDGRSNDENHYLFLRAIIGQGSACHSAAKQSELRPPL